MRIIHCFPAFTCSLILVAAALAQPATAPVPAGTGLHMGIGFVPPPGYSFSMVTPDGASVIYNSDQGFGNIMLTVTPQQSPLPQTDAMRRKLFSEIPAALKKTAPALNHQILQQPKMQNDARFFLTAHFRIKSSDGITDKRFMYRIMGKNLVLCASNALVSSEVPAEADQQAKPSHDAAAAMLQSARLGPVPAADPASPPTTNPATAPAAAPATPSAPPRVRRLPQAKIQLLLPVTWKDEITNAPSGTVATLRDSEDPTNLITVAVRPLPPEAKTQPQLRQTFIDAIVRGEKAALKIEGAQPKGESETISDPRFLKKVRTQYDTRTGPVIIESRQIAVGDAVLSITSVALQAAADTVSPIADKIATDAKAMK